MKRIWLESYPPGVPPEVDARACPTLRHLLERSCARFRERPAIANMGVELSYGELDRLSRDFGAFLRSELRLQPGDRFHGLRWRGD